MRRLILSLGALAALAAGPALADSYVYVSPRVNIVYEPYPAYAYHDESPGYYVEYRTRHVEPVTHYHPRHRVHRYHHRHHAGCRHGHGHPHGHPAHY